MLTITPAEAERRVGEAVDNFMAGYGCCQSVAAAFADLWGMDRDTALRAGAGFGAGVGRMRMMCGTVSALALLAGLERGQTRGDDREGKAGCYRLVQRLAADFRRQNGSLICAELLGLTARQAAGSSPVPEERSAAYYRRRPCAAKVESAARIYARHLTGGEAEGAD